jgi:hypothetical protein
MPDTIDFTDFKDGGLIPAGTNVIVQTAIKFGDASDGVLTFTKARDAEILKMRLKIIDGPYARQEFWQDFLIRGQTDGQKVMAGKNLGLLKLMIDSAKNLDPADESPAAHQARTLQFRDFDNLRFQAVIGVRPARTDDKGQRYDAQNIIDTVVTRNLPNWRGPIDQIAPFNDPPFANNPSPSPSAPPNGSTGTPPMAKPDWAT